MEARPYTSGRKGVCLHDLTNKVVTVPLEQQADQTACALDLWLQGKLGQITGQDLQGENDLLPPHQYRTDTHDALPVKPCVA